MLPFGKHTKLVGGFKPFFIFHNIWDNPSHWLIFFKMVKTTNQKKRWKITIFRQINARNVPWLQE
jgi:hypothetical protein